MNQIPAWTKCSVCSLLYLSLPTKTDLSYLMIHPVVIRQQCWCLISLCCSLTLVSWDVVLWNLSNLSLLLQMLRYLTWDSLEIVWSLENPFRFCVLRKVFCVQKEHSHSVCSGLLIQWMNSSDSKSFSITQPFQHSCCSNPSSTNQPSSSNGTQWQGSYLLRLLLVLSSTSRNSTLKYTVGIWV